jgi:CubicO group peptidase (beta-lactamase class C family)
VVPADWVRDSTRAYSATGSGPGYGYLWWTGTVGDSPDSGTRLPVGSFFARGAGGQYAFVIPTHDLVVVSRVDRDQHLPEPQLTSIAHLLQLILKAGGFES